MTSHINPPRHQPPQRKRTFSTTFSFSSQPVSLKQTYIAQTYQSMHPVVLPCQVYHAHNDEVSKLLSTQKTNTASGPDGISGQMLHGTAESISPAVTALFNLSLKQATFPAEWKVTNVSPIPKPVTPPWQPTTDQSLSSSSFQNCLRK